MERNREPRGTLRQLLKDHALLTAHSLPLGGASGGRAISAYDVSINIARGNGNQRFRSACLPFGGDNARVKLER